MISSLLLAFLGRSSLFRSLDLIVDNHWSPPTKTTIPAAYVRATKSLLCNGLSDPRGGSFHKVKVQIGYGSERYRPDEDVETCFGWIMPDHQVILLDGLKYPVRADLGHENVAKMIERNKFEYGDQLFGGIMFDRPTIIMPALLLARGEVQEAEQCWKAVHPFKEHEIIMLYDKLSFRYNMEIAQCYVDHRVRRAKPLAELLVLVSELLEKSGLDRSQETYAPRIEVSEAKQILRDVTRRSNTLDPKIDIKAWSKFSQPVRIAKLIEALDQVEAKQIFQPGDVEWTFDPIITALIKEGRAAVPALLDAIQFDDRLTRSIYIGRRHYLQRVIYPVRVAALDCLQTIWPSGSVGKDKAPKDQIRMLRDLWKRNANKS